MCTATTALLDRATTESAPVTAPTPLLLVIPIRYGEDICPLTGTGSCPADPEAARKCTAC
jgi:hypothetical protein